MKKIFSLLTMAVMLFAGSAWADRAQYVPDLVITEPGAVWTDSRAFVSLDAAIDDINITGGTLIIANGLSNTITSKTINHNVTLKFTHGSIIHIPAGVTLTIEGRIEAGRNHIFDDDDGVGTVIFSIATGHSSNTVAYPEWWGAVSNGVTDDASAIQSALDCGLPIVEFFTSNQLTGTDHYLVGSKLNISRSDMTLRGTSAGSLTITPEIESTDTDASILYAYDVDRITIQNLALDYDYGSNPADLSLSIPILDADPDYGRHTAGGAIHFDGVGQGVLDGIYVREGYNGIVIEDSASVYISNCVFGWSEYSNIYIIAVDQAVTDIIIRDFIINNTEGANTGIGGAGVTNDEGGTGGAIRIEGKIEYGTHDGGVGTTLIDSTQSWVASAFVGYNMYNITDGTADYITANNSTTATGGSGAITWNAGDTYSIGYNRKVHTVIIQNGDIVQSLYSLAVIVPELALSASSEPNSYFLSVPAHMFVSNCTFDSSYNDSIFINGMANSIFTSCYSNTGDKSGGYAGIAAATSSNAVRLMNSYKLQFNGCTIPLAAYNGFYVDNLTEGLKISNCSISGVGKQNTGSSGIYVEPDTNDFTLIGNTLRKGYYYGADMDYGIQVSAGNNNNYIITNNLASSVNIAGVIDLGIGDNKIVRDNQDLAARYVTEADTVMSIPSSARVVKVVDLVSASATVTSITLDGGTANFPDGHIVTLLIGTSSITFTDGGNLWLAGNFNPGVADTITLIAFDEQWYEVSRSNN